MIIRRSSDKLNLIILFDQTYTCRSSLNQRIEQRITWCPWRQSTLPLLVKGRKTTKQPLVRTTLLPHRLNLKKLFELVSYFLRYSVYWRFMNHNRKKSLFILQMFTYTLYTSTWIKNKCQLIWTHKSLYFIEDVDIDISG